jgi:hypothetical protein
MEQYQGTQTFSPLSFRVLVIKYRWGKGGLLYKDHPVGPTNVAVEQRLGGQTGQKKPAAPLPRVALSRRKAAMRSAWPLSAEGPR